MNAYGRLASLDDGWREVALGDIAEVFAGSTPSTSDPAYWGGDNVWVTPTDITNLRGRELADSARKITERGLAKVGGRTAPRDSVLVTSRATIGAAAIAACDVALNQGVTALVPSGRVNALWLYYWVVFNKDELRARGAGSTFLEISRSKMRQVPVLLPPLPEQRRIADLINHIDRVVWSLTEAEDACERALAAAREALLGRPDYPRRELGELLEGIDAGRSPRCEDRPPRIDEVGVLKVSAVRFNEFDRSESKTLPIGVDFSERHLVHSSDLLMSRANGSLHLVGAACRVDEQVANLLLSDKTLRLRVDPAALDRDFALHVLLSRPLRVQIERDATGSSGQKNISQAQIKSLVVPAPPLDEQRTIAATLEAFAADARARRADLRSLEGLRSAIGRRVMTADHRIPESYECFLSRDSAHSDQELAAV
jgi:type I restriction enzyme S subunit